MDPVTLARLTVYGSYAIWRANEGITRDTAWGCGLYVPGHGENFKMSAVRQYWHALSLHSYVQFAQSLRNVHKSGTAISS